MKKILALLVVLSALVSCALPTLIIDAVNDATEDTAKDTKKDTEDPPVVETPVVTPPVVEPPVVVVPVVEPPVVEPPVVVVPVVDATDNMLVGIWKSTGYIIVILTFNDDGTGTNKVGSLSPVSFTWSTVDGKFKSTLTNYVDTTYIVSANDLTIGIDKYTK